MKILWVLCLFAFLALMLFLASTTLCTESYDSSNPVLEPVITASMLQEFDFVVAREVEAIGSSGLGRLIVKHSQYVAKGGDEFFVGAVVSMPCSLKVGTKVKLMRVNMSCRKDLPPILFISVTPVE